MKFRSYACCSIAAFGLFIFANASEAGRIEFYEGNRGTQEKEGTVDDVHAIAWNLKNNSWDNDEIRSLRLRWVSPFTRIFLYDSPSGSENDDWVMIQVKRWREEIVIDHLEIQEDDPRADTYDYLLQYYRPKGGWVPTLGETRPLPDLNGKVSHIKVQRGSGADPPIDARIERCIQREFLFWDKKGSAHQISSSDSNYRLWFPSYSSNSSSVVVSYKMDHIRNKQRDDHAQVRMEFDNAGLLTDSNMEIALHDEAAVRTSLANVIDGIPEAVRLSKEAMIAEASARLAGELYALSGTLLDSGGRKNFPSVIEHVMRGMGEALGKDGCIPEPVWIPRPPVQ